MKEIFERMRFQERGTVALRMVHMKVRCKMECAMEAGYTGIKLAMYSRDSG